MKLRCTRVAIVTNSITTTAPRWVVVLTYMLIESSSILLKNLISSLCGRPNHPHYGSCPSVGPSVRTVWRRRVLTWKQKSVRILRNQNSIACLSDFGCLHPFRRYSRSKFEVVFSRPSFCTFWPPTFFGGKAPKIVGPRLWNGWTFRIRGKVSQRSADGVRRSRVEKKNERNERISVKHTSTRNYSK